MHRASIASILSFKRFPFSLLAAFSKLSKHFLTFSLSLSLLILSNFLICKFRTSVLSISLTSKESSFCDWYLLTPTITSSAESILACLFAAVFSIASFGIPFSIALFIGYFFDIMSWILKRKFTISSIRIKKFVANTNYCNKKISNFFNPPFKVEDGLRNTIDFEFLDKN